VLGRTGIGEAYKYRFRAKFESRRFSLLRGYGLNASVIIFAGFNDETMLRKYGDTDAYKVLKRGWSML